MAIYPWQQIYSYMIEQEKRIRNTFSKCWMTLSTHFWWLSNLVISIGSTRTSFSIKPWYLPTSKNCQILIQFWDRKIKNIKSKCPESLHRCILPRQRCLTALSLSSDRAEITSLAPCFAASIASAAPMPVDAPVIQITCPFKSSLKTTIIYKNEMIDIIPYNP